MNRPTLTLLGLLALINGVLTMLLVITDHLAVVDATNWLLLSVVLALLA